MIIPKSNGHLLCEICGTYWCLHVEAYVQGSEDVIYIWSEHPNDQVIEVPIIPTSNLWAEVTLISPPSAKATMYRVEYAMGNIPHTWEMLGFIHPSEGRSVMRSMILDWFVGTQVTDGMMCTSRAHGYKSTVELQKDMNNPSRKIAQQWSIAMTGRCLGCTFDASANKDLVPDGAAKPGSPW